jgi:hypothetical protein
MRMRMYEIRRGVGKNLIARRQLRSSSRSALAVGADIIRHPWPPLVVSVIGSCHHLHLRPPLAPSCCPTDSFRSLDLRAPPPGTIPVISARVHAPLAPPIMLAQLIFRLQLPTATATTLLLIAAQL